VETYDEVYEEKLIFAGLYFVGRTLAYPMYAT
jgi:hypothetical protein